MARQVLGGSSESKARSRPSSLYRKGRDRRRIGRAARGPRPWGASISRVAQPTRRLDPARRAANRIGSCPGRRGLTPIRTRRFSTTEPGLAGGPRGIGERFWRRRERPSLIAPARGRLAFMLPRTDDRARGSVAIAASVPGQPPRGHGVGGGDSPRRSYTRPATTTEGRADPPKPGRQKPEPPKPQLSDRDSTGEGLSPRRHTPISTARSETRSRRRGGSFKALAFFGWLR